MHGWYSCSATMPLRNLGRHRRWARHFALHLQKGSSSPLPSPWRSSALSPHLLLSISAQSPPTPGLHHGHIQEEVAQDERYVQNERRRADVAAVLIPNCARHHPVFPMGKLNTYARYRPLLYLADGFAMTGLLIRITGYLEQAFSEHSENQQGSIVRSSSGILWVSNSKSFLI